MLPITKQHSHYGDKLLSLRTRHPRYCSFLHTMISTHIIRLIILISALASIYLLEYPNITYNTLSALLFPNATNGSSEPMASRQADINTSHRTFLYVCMGTVGFGSEINNLLLGLAYSLGSRRKFLVDCRNWTYGRFGDFFRLPEGSDHSLPYVNLTTNERVNEQIKYLKVVRSTHPLASFRRATRKIQTIEAKRRAAHRLWQRMTAETSAFVEHCRITNLSNYIAVHVRRGDKLIKEAREVPLVQYIQKIEQTLPGKQFRPVFVASDDLAVPDEFSQLRPMWTFFSINNTIPYASNYTGHTQFKFNSLPLDERMNQTRLLICEIQMLVDADYVFCTMSSNICRLVQALRHQDPSTAISLDTPWRAT